jgi:hypothetical protein
MKINRFISAIVATSTIFLSAGCQSPKTTTGTATTTTTATVEVPAPTPAPPAVVVTPAPATPPASVQFPIRIKGGVSTTFTNTDGTLWLPDQGFADGDTTDRAEDLKVENTATPALYRSEHYGMTKFSYPVPNGKYVVKLYFAETYEGVTDKGQRVFSYSVNGHEFKDFDIFVKAGGSDKAYVETVPVEVTEGKVEITFTPNVENPEINGIEITPAS